MKNLMLEEFEDRVNALQRARKIFNNLTGNNISKSFEAYQEILAEQKREVQVSAKQGNKTILDFYNRPECPDCGAEMQIRPLPKNEENVKTQLVCTKCDTLLNSDMTLDEWLKELGPKDETRPQ